MRTLYESYKIENHTSPSGIKVIALVDEIFRMMDERKFTAYEAERVAYFLKEEVTSRENNLLRTCGLPYKEV